MIGQSFSLMHFFYGIILSPFVTLFKFGSKQKETKENIDAICTKDVDCPVWEKNYDDLNTMKMVLAGVLYRLLI